MKSLLHFIFRGKLYTCNVYVGNGERASRIYVVLLDKDVISEFGDEITVNMDFVKELDKGSELQGLPALHKAILKAAQFHPAFLLAKEKKSASVILRASMEKATALRLRQPYSFAGPAWE